MKLISLVERFLRLFRDTTIAGDDYAAGSEGLMAYPI